MDLHAEPGSSNARVEDMEIIVQEPWRIASRERSSTTREYIGAIDDIAGLRTGSRQCLGTPAGRYWRKFPFKISAQVQRQLRRLLTATQDELAQLRARQDRPE